jgi:ankyrin repeat protein
MHTHANQGHTTPRLCKADRSLIKAIENDDLVAIESLIAQGANIELRDEDGWTPVMLAAIYERHDSLALLVSRGADVEARDFEGWTALMAAASDGDKRSVDILLSAGALVHVKDSAQRSPLICACYHALGDHSVIDLLLDAGADPEDTDDEGVSAIERAEVIGHPHIVERMKSIVFSRKEKLALDQATTDAISSGAQGQDDSGSGSRRL